MTLSLTAISNGGSKMLHTIFANSQYTALAGISNKDTIMQNAGFAGHHTAACTYYRQFVEFRVYC